MPGRRTHARDVLSSSWRHALFAQGLAHSPDPPETSAVAHKGAAGASAEGTLDCAIGRAPGRSTMGR